jgi:DNA polymerase III epsilon subunit-like protein
MRYVVVDVETTGMSVQRGGRVIEVGAVALEDGVFVAELETLIDAGAPIDYGAFRVHGISEAVVPRILRRSATVHWTTPAWRLGCGWS